MGYAKSLRRVRKPRLPALLRRRKQSKDVAKTKIEYEFRVMANPKEHTNDMPDGCNKTFDTAATDETDQNSVDVLPPSTGFGWLFTACLGDTLGGSAATATVTASNKEEKAKEDQSLQASSYDDESGESSVPSMSRINQVLKVNRRRPDDVSEITMIPSIDDDEDSNYSEDQSLYSKNKGGKDVLQKGNSCAWWPVS